MDASVPGRVKCGAQTTDDETADHARLTEAHLRLGRVDVDIDLVGRNLKEQSHDRMAVAGE
jgi:hypothetical protein